MKVKDLRSLNEKELDDKVLDISKELMKLNGQVAVGTTPKNPGQIKQLKKTLAKIKTIKKEKEKNKA